MAPISQKDNPFVRHATAIAIGIVTFGFLLTIGLFLSRSAADQNARFWVDHTFAVRRHINLLLNRFDSSQAAERGYLLTGNRNLLQPYEDALRDGKAPPLDDFFTPMHRSIAQEIALLRRLTYDNPVQQANLDELELRSTALLGDWAAAIKTHQSVPGEPASQSLDSLLNDENLMDRVHEQLHVMDAEEAYLLKQRQEVAGSDATYNAWFTIVGTLLSYGFLVTAILLYQRARNRSQAQLMLYNQELEKRGEELKMQQEELKASNEEIEASNEELEEKTRALEEQNDRAREQSKDLEAAKRLLEEKAGQIEQASRYKSEFLANMSHELRTPLNSLLILSRGFAANETGNLTEEQVEEARVIHNAGSELLELINDILDLSKVEAGKISIILDDTPLEGIIGHLRQCFEPVAKDKGVAFQIERDPALPGELRTDAQRVAQIMKNLLSNAFKFTRQGSVTLSLRRPAPRAQLQRPGLNPGNTLALAVTDTGIGINESKLKDIFEAFQQEDGSVDRHYGGTGLGLTIARHFANLLGGEIQVESRKNRGSTFTLFLPLAAGAAAASHEPAVAADRPARRFIADDIHAINPGDPVLLIIEDNASFAAALKKIAHARGFKVLVAGEGEAGLALAAEYAVTAILLGLRLPDFHGLKLLDRLKQNPITQHIPVHIISGDEDVEEAVPLGKGAISFLPKPASGPAIDALLDRIPLHPPRELKHVLLIEDDPNSQKAIRALLRKKNIGVEIAGTGLDGLVLLKQRRFDCIILDLGLPDMSGFDWLRAVDGTIGQAARPPVVVHTARELTEEEHRSLGFQTSGIVIKGASSPERLLDEVTLFLHSVETSLPEGQTGKRMQLDPDQILKGRNVLLVDDDMRNTFALSKLLKKHGLNVAIADNGQMALDRLRENQKTDLVILDIMMPVMDGYQAMQEIRRNPDWARLPIIALTASAMPEERERCIAAGATDYMTKPVDIDRLITLLRVCLFRQEELA